MTTLLMKVFMTTMMMTAMMLVSAGDLNAGSNVVALTILPLSPVILTHLIADGDDFCRKDTFPPQRENLSCYHSHPPLPSICPLLPTVGLSNGLVANPRVSEAPQENWFARRSRIFVPTKDNFLCSKVPQAAAQRPLM